MGMSAVFSADFTDYVRGVQQADGALVVLKNQTAATTNTIGGLHQGLSQVDRILASLGINIGPQVRALGEMANVSGKTASQIGMIATAGLAVSAAFAGWQFGRWIADWLNLDDAIGKAAASLFGWGDASAQVAGARMDVLTRATKIAGTEITNYNEALKIIKASTDAFSDSMNNSMHRVSLWQGEIRKVRANGDIDNLKADLEAQNGTLKQLSAQYGISVEALQYFVRQTKAADTATKEFTETQKKADAELRAFRNWIGEREKEDHKRVLEEKAKAEKEYREYLNWLGVRQMEDEAARMKQREDEHLASIARMAAAEATLAGLTLIGGVASLGQRGVVTFDENGNMQNGGGSQFVPGSNVTTFGAGPMVNQNTVNSAGRFGTNVVINAPINVVDTQDNLARSIGQQITQAVMRGTKFS